MDSDGNNHTLDSLFPNSLESQWTTGKICPFGLRSFSKAPLGIFCDHHCHHWPGYLRRPSGASCRSNAASHPGNILALLLIYSRGWISALDPQQGMNKRCHHDSDALMVMMISGWWWWAFALILSRISGVIMILISIIFLHQHWCMIYQVSIFSNYS